MRAVTLGLLAITATVTASATERWPQFRGEGCRLGGGRPRPRLVVAHPVGRQRVPALGEMSLATPALAHGSLFLRTSSKLYRIQS